MIIFNLAWILSLLKMNVGERSRYWIQRLCSFSFENIVRMSKWERFASINLVSARDTLRSCAKDMPFLNKWNALLLWLIKWLFGT